MWKERENVEKCWTLRIENCVLITKLDIIPNCYYQVWYCIAMSAESTAFNNKKRPEDGAYNINRKIFVGNVSYRVSYDYQQMVVCNCKPFDLSELLEFWEQKNVLMCCRVLGRLGRILSLNVYVWVLAFGVPRKWRKRCLFQFII